MTATAHRPGRAPGGAPGGASGGVPRRAPAGPSSDLRSRSAARRTLLALLASALGMFPLKALFSDSAWLLDVWATMAIVILPAALIRLRRPAGALDVWPGIILLVPWLTARFLSEHARWGFVPTGRTWDDITALMDALHKTSRDEVAPIQTTVAVRLVLCALLGLLAALIDLIAVVGRRGALAGVPLLVVYTIAGAVPRGSVAWPWFALAAVAYLLLLALDASDDLESWGRRVRAPNAARSRGALAVSTQRIAVGAIAVAVVLPFVLPTQSRNLIADAFHNGKGNGLGGFGPNGSSSGITPFAALKGQLDRPNPVPIADVKLIDAPASARPFNLRLNVLTQYSDRGWDVESHGSTEPLNVGGFDTEPETPAVSSTQLEAKIAIRGLTGNAPVFTVPTSVDGLSGDTRWSARDQLLLDAKVGRGTTYTVRFNEVKPTLTQLRDAPDVTDIDPRYLQGTDAVTPKVRSIIAGIIKGKTSPYAKARAISDYFANPDNGFTYDLKVPEGDSSSQLQNFLEVKRGYCQQYAAAMGIMLRVAGVPSRVVLGYEHEVPDATGSFTVTTNDAHAWVEAYFQNVGWVPFDPTPIGGLSGDSTSDLGWAPHDYPSDAPSASSSAPSSAVINPNKPQETDSATPTANGDTGSSFPIPLAGLGAVLAVLVLVALVLIPAAVRWRRRARRYAAIRHSADADALWAELSDTAVDLGYVWSPARSPRQVATWLGADAADSAGPLREIALAVEQRRYSPAPSDQGAASSAAGEALAGDLRSVTEALRGHHDGRTRFRAVFWPASLGWHLGAPGRRARRAR